MEVSNLDSLSYNNLLKIARPLDIIAFRGGDMISDVISMLEKYEVGCGDFTHVGIIVTSKLMPEVTINDTTIQLQDDRLYLYQSTINYRPTDDIDIVSKECEVGVSLCDLETVVTRYLENSTKTKVAYCRLINYPTIDNIIIDKFKQFYINYYERLYELNVFSLLALIFPELRKMRDLQDLVFNKLASKLSKILRRYGLIADINDENFNPNNINPDNLIPNNWVFCSELIVLVYQNIGLIDNTINPRDIMPVDIFGYDQDGLSNMTEKPVYILLHK